MSDSEDFIRLPHSDSGPMGTWTPVGKLGSTKAILAPETRTELEKVEEEFAHRQQLAQFGLTHKQKLLFYGPPGNGKSFSARRLARNLGLPLWLVPNAQMVSRWVGSSSEHIFAVFRFARENPCVLLIDEFDSITSKRRDVEQAADQEMNHTTNTMLQMMEQGGLAGVVVFTTNFHKQLDFALFRRFDALVKFDMPTPPMRGQIMEMTLSKMLPVSFRMEPLALASEGLSAALLVEACKNAMKTAVMAGANVVNTGAVLREIQLMVSNQRELLGY